MWLEVGLIIVLLYVAWIAGSILTFVYAPKIVGIEFVRDDDDEEDGDSQIANLVWCFLSWPLILIAAVLVRATWGPRDH